MCWQDRAWRFVAALPAARLQSRQVAAVADRASVPTHRPATTVAAGSHHITPLLRFVTSSFNFPSMLD